MIRMMRSKASKVIRSDGQILIGWCSSGEDDADDETTFLPSLSLSLSLSNPTNTFEDSLSLLLLLFFFFLSLVSCLLRTSYSVSAHRSPRFVPILRCFGVH
ncbi:unnamed protein product [Citrullus colocynthis]|uniref:Uncharacterized protein n=1 Tax=Citrullus colocynthis TaxID=252529 RepID=A0ABP0Z9R9_9ROSI